MKPPKEPRTWRRPRLYYQEAPGDKRHPSRIRIIYPDGKSEWFWYNSSPVEVFEPCWSESYYKSETIYGEAFGQDSSPYEALCRMREYDKRNGWPPADFLGEL